jgi:hypothetical protein
MTSGNAGGWRRVMGRIGRIVAGLVVVTLVGFGLLFHSGGNAVRAFCRDATPGLPVARLAALAAADDVRLTAASGDGFGGFSLFAYSPRSFGRHNCLVRHDNDVIIESRYGFAD